MRQPSALSAVTIAFVVVALLASVDAIAAGAKNGRGKVTYITDKVAYLDVGTQQGLAPGTQLKLLRRKKPVGTCTVSEISLKGAVCAGEAEPGDTFTFPVTATPTPPPTTPAPPDTEEIDPTKKRDPLPSAKDMAEKRKLVEAAPVERVVHERSAVEGATWAVRGSTTLRQEVWGSSATVGYGMFSRTTFDGGVHAGLGFYRGAFAAASMRVVSDWIAPSAASPQPNAQRFRPNELVELYVWNASVGVNEGLIIGELGRFRPRRLPGIQILDGAQLAVRIDTVEVGAYGGLVPDFITLYPAVERISSGAYFAGDFKAGEGVIIMPRVRAGALMSADLVTIRPEIEAMTEVFVLGIGSVGGSVRASTGLDFVPSLDAARADAELTIVKGFRFAANYRYLAPLAFDFDAAAGAQFALVPPGPVGGVHHGSTSAAYEIVPGIAVGALAGGGYDVVADALRGWVGPEIRMSSLFGDLGGMDFGYLEELGNFPGRSAWVGSHFTPLSIVRLLARVSYFETQALGDTHKETAILTMVDAPVLPWLTLRGRGSVQQSLPSLDGTARAIPTLFYVDLGVTGDL